MVPDVEHQKFPPIPRLAREVIITEKIDGTNALVYVTEDGRVFAGSRNRWITPENDNYGFARWVAEHSEELRELGPGHHYGEWWGLGIQRGYDLDEKRFSLFNVHRWAESRPACCHVVPLLNHVSTLDVFHAQVWLDVLQEEGSRAAPGFMQPEGVVLYHTHARSLFKMTLGDDGHKGG